MGSKFIYAMSSCGFVKVGVSGNPVLRSKSINTPDDINVWSTDIKYTNPYEIESICHRELLESNVKGEWYNCSHEEAIKIIVKTCKEHGEKCKGEAEDKNIDVSDLILSLYGEELITGTLLRRNQDHRMIYAELVSTYEIDWISEGELRLLITDDALFEEIKKRLKVKNK